MPNLNIKTNPSVNSIPSAILKGFNDKRRILFQTKTIIGIHMYFMQSDMQHGVDMVDVCSSR